MKSSLLWTCAVIASFATSGRAETIVDESSPLETISTEFMMCDGPAWDGGSSLYVPDVKGGKLYRYRPGPKKLDVVLADAGRISATLYNHGRLFLADNGESCISRLQNGKKVVIAGNDKEAKPPLRPNDLVVDNQGGIYYTLTGPGKVLYITADGKQLAAVEKIDSPNGLILSPDERTLYVSSYGPKKIWAYDVLSPGSVSAGRLFASMDDGPDKGADGMGRQRLLRWIQACLGLESRRQVARKDRNAHAPHQLHLRRWRYALALHHGPGRTLPTTHAHYRPPATAAIASRGGSITSERPSVDGAAGQRDAASGRSLRAIR
jgi:sugar lactone lactonase YvrE